MAGSRDEFFEDQKEWSARKLQIITKYLDGFVRILGKKGQVFYVDGFAGPGVYQDGTIGSPILAAEFAQKLLDEQKAYSLTCINVEKDIEYITNLEHASKRFGQLVVNLQGTFARNVDGILQIIAGQPTIFFLDDFGVIGLDWAAMQKIIGRKAPTDLWVRFDHTTVRRLDGFFASKSPGAERKFGRLPQLYGVKSREQLHEELDGPTPEIRIKKALRLYLKQLATEFSIRKGRGFAAAYLIRSLPGRRKYHLVFSASHPKAAILASSIVFNTEESYQKEVKDLEQIQSRQPYLFSIEPTSDEIFNAKVQKLKQEIWKFSRGKTVSRIDIHTHLFEAWFGKMSGRHLTAALRQLVSEGKITDVDGQISSDYAKLTFQS